MAKIQLRGYDVDFPYAVPYDIQKNYMEKVLTCLDEKRHAVLESPTGTGKTLCLFAPITAWATRKKFQNIPYVTENDCRDFQPTGQDDKWGHKTSSKIWYTTRTHSQIAQTVSEVRKCNIAGLQVKVRGARDQLCINKIVLEEKESYIKTFKCKELIKNKQCKYYTKLNYERDFHKYYPSGEVLNIEDLVSVGKSCGVCPYFLAKKSSENADIVLLPYNYIIDKELRTSNEVNLKNDVIIFDEGHNVPSSCEESYEFSFSSLNIAIGIQNMKELMLSLTKLADTLIEDEDIDVASHASNSMLIMSVLQKLESGLHDLPISNELLPVSCLYEFFKSAGVNENTYKEIVNGIANFKEDSSKLTITGSTAETFKMLEKMMTVVFGPTVRSFDETTIAKSFKCGITVDPERHNVKKLSLFCFNPSFGIRSLLDLGVQSIIITSGTLSPITTFIFELGLPNPIILENGHIAKKCQVPFIILGSGVNNVRMDGAFKNRNNPKYVFSLGMTLTNLISSIPDGVLLLFSSYTMMQNLKDAWDTELGIWTRLNSLKRVFVEPRNKDEFINCMENYKRAIDAGNGAILMGVLRGKISEGMDFKDQYCRGVFIIGVPFSPVRDPRVQGKEKYAESLTIINPSTKTEEKLYNGSFMSVEAMKATNQAIGRVIRHYGDYGVIVLIDYRFARPNLFYNISRWLRDESPVEHNFPATKKLIREFFTSVHKGKLGVEEIRCQKVDSNGSPIASYVSFEEYDRRKTASQPVSWIGGSSDKSHSYAVTKSRGSSNIEYTDDDTNSKSQNLISFYKIFNSKSSEPKNTTKSEFSSLFEALESSNSSIGYKEFDKSEFEKSNSNSKRKYESDEKSFSDSDQHSPSSIPALPETSHRPPKKFPRIKIRPLIPFTENEPETENATPEASKNDSRQNKSKSIDEEELKVKLINYYRKVKEFLSKENDGKFKITSSRYMKGEAMLEDMIALMDDIFLLSKHGDLFTGFGICVKGRDKDKWAEACRKRNLNVL